MIKKGEKRMFFWKNKLYHIHINSFKASLQSCHEKINPNKSDIINNPKRINERKSERTFSFTPSSYQASMCLEASLSFSFFFLFLVNVFSIIFLFMNYTEDMISLQQQGKTMASYSYFVKGDRKEDDDICLQKNRVVESSFPILSIPKCRLYTQCIVKPWTGYDVTKESKRKPEEKTVYMTDYGNVYHKNRGCGYLVLSIKAVAADTVNEKRNESGECYLPCEFCKDEGFVTVVYITSYGNRYHLNYKCRGIKRSVKEIPFSEVKGASLCKKCG